MNQVKKLWNWRPDPALMKTAKARAIRGLGAFLALMVMCTLVARAADTITVPVVTVATPTRSALTHTYSVSGMLETAGGTPVLAPSGMTVTEVAVAQGDIVAEGDLLFTVDTTETAREIAAKQLTLQSLRLELADLQKKLALADEKAGTDFDRAEEDYDSVEAAWELKLQEAGERLRQARTALMKYDGIRSWDYDDEEFTEEEYNSLRSEYRTASIAYDQAEAEREDALREAKRKVDDLDDPEPEPDSSPARKSLDIRQTELELAALYEAVATEGEVHAPARHRDPPVGGGRQAHGRGVPGDHRPGGQRALHRRNHRRAAQVCGTRRPNRADSLRRDPGPGNPRDRHPAGGRQARYLRHHGRAAGGYRRAGPGRPGQNYPAHPGLRRLRAC